MGLKAYRVIVDMDKVTKKLPFRKHTSKKSIMDWCIARNGEPFTKTEFLEAVKELKAQGLVESVMDDDTCARAWWNEMYTKYEFLIEAPKSE